MTASRNDANTSTAGGAGFTNIVWKLFALIDSIVELYLGKVVKPFLSLHETFYTALNKALRQLLDDHATDIPDWFTANFITYARTVLVVPTLILLAWDCALLPSLIFLLVDFGDFLDGVVARFWVDVTKKRETELSQKEKSASSLTSLASSAASSPTHSDDDSFGTSHMQLERCWCQIA